LVTARLVGNVKSARCRQNCRFGSIARDCARNEIALSRIVVVPPGWIEQPTPGLGNLCSIH
jgi:hypothetical protein